MIAKPRPMSKMLTTITLLCFSVAANADIYTCTTKARSSVGHFPGPNDPNYFNMSNVGEDGGGFVVDTDRGIRTILPDRALSNLDQERLRRLNERYYGSCTIDSNQITCQNSSPGRFSMILINTSEIPYKFTRSDILFSDGSGGAEVGTCIKI